MDGNLDNFNAIFLYFGSDILKVCEYMWGVDIDKFKKVLNNGFPMNVKVMLLSFRNECKELSKNEVIEKSKIIFDSFRDDDDFQDVWTFSSNDLVIEIALYCIEKFGFDFVSRNIENTAFLEMVVSSESLLNKIIEIVPEEKISYLFELLVSNDVRFSFIHENNMDRVVKYLNGLDDLKLVMMFDYMCVNDFWRKVLFSDLVDRKKENLILEKFRNLSIFFEHETTDFILAMAKVGLFPEEIIDYIADNFNDYMPNMLIVYLNDVIANERYSKNKVLANTRLMQYVSTFNIKQGLCVDLTEEELLESKKYFAEMSYDELIEGFLDDEYTANVIKRLDGSSILQIYPFNFFIGVNGNINDVIYKFFEKYLSYNKAVFLVDLLNIEEREKVNILNTVYPGKNVSSVKVSKEELIERNIKSLLNLEMPVSEEFKEILPELVSLPYDEKVFNNLKKIGLNIRCYEYLRVYLSQLIKFIINKEGLEVNSVEITEMVDKGDWGNAYWINSEKMVKIYYNCFGVLDSDVILRFDELCFHEVRHAFQYQKMGEMVSIDALMCNLEIELSNNDWLNYYKKNYYNVYIEVDARVFGIYETFRFLNDIDQEIANEFLEENDCIIGDGAFLENADISKVSGSKKGSYLEKLKYNKMFLEDRRRAKSVEYFCSLINTFFGVISREKIIELRERYETLKLITDDLGRLCNDMEIEERMRLIKSYSTNDLEYNQRERDIKVFYVKYLNNLRYGLKNNLIEVDFGMRTIKNV